MRIQYDFYDLFPTFVWENEAEELRGKALNRLQEAAVMEKIHGLRQAITELSVELPGEEGIANKLNLNLLKGKYLALTEMLGDSQTANSMLNQPND